MFKIKNSNSDILSSTRPYIFITENHGKDFSVGRREWPPSRVWNTSGRSRDSEICPMIFGIKILRLDFFVSFLIKQKRKLGSHNFLLQKNTSMIMFFLWNKTQQKMYRELFLIITLSKVKRLYFLWNQKVYISICLKKKTYLLTLHKNN